MSTNLDSVFNVTKQVIEGMVAQQWGRIINISSVNATKGAFGQTNYQQRKQAFSALPNRSRWKSQKKARP